MERITISGKTQATLDAERETEERAATNDAAQAYLRETDWYVIRLAETGAEIPEEIRTERNTARNNITEAHHERYATIGRI